MPFLISQKGIHYVLYKIKNYKKSPNTVEAFLKYPKKINLLVQ